MTSDKEFDLQKLHLREINDRLQNSKDNSNHDFKIINPMGAHALAAGIKNNINISIHGHVGYYCAGMNQNAKITINGNAGVGLAENMMSGKVVLNGDASQSAGASGHGGLLLINGNASSRCGISMKGINIIVKGSVGHNSAFMAQAGNLVVCGDADDGLGDSIYETIIFLKGKINHLGADCVEKEMKEEHINKLAALLDEANLDYDPNQFRRYGSNRKLYNFDVKNIDEY
tara:strand:- start:436 stop:1125 length:690 start_codon:yes stop_codon:yes gene_type:complete